MFRKVDPPLSLAPLSHQSDLRQGSIFASLVLCHRVSLRLTLPLHRSGPSESEMAAIPEDLDRYVTDEPTTWRRLCKYSLVFYALFRIRHHVIVWLRYIEKSNAYFTEPMVSTQKQHHPYSVICLATCI